MTLSRVLAESVQAALVNRIQQVDRGARERNDLLVIREAQCPACLVEVVFMSNYTEELMLLDPAFRQKAAEGIAAGVMSFFGFHEEMCIRDRAWRIKVINAIDKKRSFPAN